jgi:hypothetical protein
MKGEEEEKGKEEEKERWIYCILVFGSITSFIYNDMAE